MGNDRANSESNSFEEETEQSEILDVNKLNSSILKEKEQIQKLVF